MGEQENEMRSHIMDLVRQRDEYEAKILRALDELNKLNVGMDDPLVDSEGYPRNDVDVYAVRSLRQKIICCRNDCKNLTRQIEEGLHALHLNSDAIPAQGTERPAEKRSPFAKVDIVDVGSPAEKANLRAGDLLTKFANITDANFENFASLASIVANNVGRPIRVNVLRDNVTVPLILIPEEWNGPGHLGCRIVPLK